MAKHEDAIPDTVLDQAFQWAVTLHSGTISVADRQAFDNWLNAAPAHQQAWHQVQAVEDEFSSLRDRGEAARETLDKSVIRRKRKRAGLGTAMVLLVLSGWLWLAAPAHWHADYRTGAGEQLVLTLPAGTRLWLNSGTRADVAQAGQGSVITLHTGEILLDSSAVDADRKPVVQTKYGHFRPLGTRFTVTARDDHAELAVIKGRVEAVGQPPGNARVVRRGQRWRLTADGAGPAPGIGLQPGVWVDGVIEADNAPLGTVLNALAQHRRGWLHYAPELEDLKVTGVFRIDDTDSALRALEVSLPVRVSYVMPFWVEVKPR